MNEKVKRPHIVILNPDEMRWDAMGHMGNRAAHTPALDRLAVHDAVSFDHAYCQNPVCVPSRCSFLTGLYPHTKGHRTMRYLMQEGEVSLFSELKNAGYHVWMNGRNDFYAGQVPGLGAYHADEIFEFPEDAGKKAFVQKRPAADSKVEIIRKNKITAKFMNQEEHISGKSHGARTGQISMVADTKRADTWPPETRILDDPNHVYSHFHGLIPEKKNDQDWLDTKAAVERIHHINQLGDQPLCLFLGWMNPHPPYEVEEKYYNMIPADRIEKPINPADCSGKSEMMQRLQEFSHLEKLSGQEWQEMRHVYLAQCAKVDHMVDTVIDALKEEGIYDDTAIFIFSDHGDWCGDYHLAEKAQNCFEDALTRVPFLIKPPKQTGEVVDAGLASGPVELIDFYATAMDYAGVQPCHDHFGKSLRPILTDRTRTIRRFAFCEGGRNPEEYQCDEWHSDGPDGGGNRGDYYAKKRAQLDSSAHEKGTMITDGVWKYIYRSSGKCELYNLQEDPKEMENLYPLLKTEQEKDGKNLSGSDETPQVPDTRPENKRKIQEVQEIVGAFEKEILKWYQQTCDLVPRTYDRRMSEDKLWKIMSNFVPAEYEEYCREYIRECSPGIGELIAFARTLTSESI